MAVKRSSNVLIAAATLIGTSIESYDFIVYGYAAALVFPALFFPKADAFAGQIASYAIFWLGFLGRPLGGVIFGHFGDRLGRKAMLVTTLSIMGVATFLVGLLPTYDRIGFWAPVLLVTLRLFQGVAAGGEFGGAVLLAAEHAQENRRGLLSSYPQMGVPFGLVLASLAFIAVIAPHAANGNVSLMGNAWRYPFLFSIVLVAIGLAIRWRITESPAFERAKAQAKIVAAPVLAVLRANWKEVLLTGGAFVAISAGFYLVTTQIFSYGAGPQSVLKLDARVFFIANLVGS
ncbi:MAG TPA: MFS transporter, partial [Candidatus Tumulicola sp.]